MRQILLGFLISTSLVFSGPAHALSLDEEKVRRVAEVSLMTLLSLKFGGPMAAINVLDMARTERKQAVLPTPAPVEFQGSSVLIVEPDFHEATTNDAVIDDGVVVTTLPDPKELPTPKRRQDDLSLEEIIVTKVIELPTEEPGTEKSYRVRGKFNPNPQEALPADLQSLNFEFDLVPEGDGFSVEGLTILD